MELEPEGMYAIINGELIPQGGKEMPSKNPWEWTPDSDTITTAYGQIVQCVATVFKNNSSEGVQWKDAEGKIFIKNRGEYAIKAGTEGLIYPATEFYPNSKKLGGYHPSRSIDERKYRPKKAAHRRVNKQNPGASKEIAPEERYNKETGEYESLCPRCESKGRPAWQSPHNWKPSLKYLRPPCCILCNQEQAEVARRPKNDNGNGGKEPTIREKRIDALIKELEELKKSGS